MRSEALKVGELAKRTGLTIRTLHHYDEIGLVKPSSHTESGHRLYTAGDLARLQQVLSLRQIGFSLDQIRDCLDKPDFSPVELIRVHVARLQEQIKSQRELCRRLETLATYIQTAGDVSASDLLDLIAKIAATEKHYTPAQMEFVTQRAEKLDENQVAQAPADWANLIRLVRAEMEMGTDRQIGGSRFSRGVGWTS
jgi:DNA-binding transcriptional MerR regulator